MTPSSIRLLPPDQPDSKSAPMPTDISRRWWSDIEDGIQAPPVKVFLTQKAYVKINLHAGSDLDNEVGGWLVGNWHTDPESDAKYIVVETFTHDSQLAMYDEMDERFPDSEAVGWYHTHPRMGVFLSKYDVFLHNHFFPNPWQVALVIEPHSRTAGFFIPKQDGTLDARYYYGFNEIHNGTDRSVVHWQNVYTDPEPTIQEEEYES
jgi:proteasome lid subunit RPN8/RPN11